VSPSNGNYCIRVFERLREHPHRLALWSPSEGIVSYEVFGRLIASQQRTCRSLSLDVGDVVVVLALPSPVLYAAIVALMGFGCSVVLIEPWMPAHRVDSLIGELKPKALFADWLGQLRSLRSHSLRSLRRISLMSVKNVLRRPLTDEQLELRPVDSKFAAFYSFTSVTAGQSTGIVRSHDSLWRLQEIVLKYGMDGTPSGTDLTTFPLRVLFNLSAGRGSLLLPPSWSLSALQKIRDLDKEHWPQSLSCSPAFLRRLIDYDFRLSSLSLIQVGGAMVECDLLEAALDAWPKARILQVYGGTDLEPISLCDARMSVEKSRGKGFIHALNVGFPIDEFKTKWDDEGILWVSCPSFCPEFFGDDVSIAQKVKRDELGLIWQRTGDRILSDGDGFWYAGRESQSADDFFFEQKLYAKIGHSRAFIYRDALSNEVIVADDDKMRVESAAKDIDKKNHQVWTAIIARDSRHRSRIDRLSTWQGSLRMQRWMTYLKERNPLTALFVLALGLVLSGYFLSQVQGVCSKFPQGSCLEKVPDVRLGLLAVVSLILFLILARMMNELKDFETDKVSHPSRPLPRGLIDQSEMRLVIRVVFGLLILLSATHFLLSAPFAAILFLSSSLYLWLLYRDFYLAGWWSNFLVTYVLLYQVVAIHFYLYGVSLFAPAFAGEFVAWLFVAMNVTASLTFEFVRKLRPTAHPAAQTYRQRCGVKKAALTALAFDLLAAVVSIVALFNGFPSAFYLLFIQVLVAALVFRILVCDKNHSLAEWSAGLMVLLSAWIGVLVLFRMSPISV
jgi:acyl-coenzyme A synthetase/AMP-(fatty) acid ligase/4-hydroxybenzoate polyprenyltransferase